MPVVHAGLTDDEFYFAMTAAKQENTDLAKWVSKIVKAEIQRLQTTHTQPGKVTP